MLKIAKAAGCMVGTTTNCTLLDRKNIEKMVAQGLDVIGFSLAGVDKENDKKIRYGREFYNEWTYNNKCKFPLKSDGSTDICLGYYDDNIYFRCKKGKLLKNKHNIRLNSFNIYGDINECLIEIGSYNITNIFSDVTESQISASANSEAVFHGFIFNTEHNAIAASGLNASSIIHFNGFI